MMRPVIGIVLICFVNVALGDEQATDTCHTPIELNPDEAKCGEGLGRPKTDFGDTYDFTYTNKGATETSAFLQVDVQEDIASKMSVTIGDHEYRVLDFHFHVGEKSKLEGSQHTLNGKYLPLEFHIELKRKDVEGDAALAFFVDQAEGADNAALTSLANAIKNLKNLQGEGKVQVNLNNIVAPAIQEPFYQYNGTHTTEPCHGSVLWTVYEKPLTISKAQMDEFTAIYNADNFRPIRKPGGEVSYSAKSCLRPPRAE